MGSESGSTLLAYSTAKLVLIKDARLTVSYYVCVFGVFLYTLFYVLLMNKQYLDLDDTDFSIRLNLQQPANPNAMDPTSLQYCSQSGNTTIFDRPTNPCLVLDEFDVVFPPPQGGSLFVASRISMSNVSLPAGCTERTSLSCRFPFVPDKTADTYFTAGIEDFTMFVDHTLIASSFKITKPSNEMLGSLIGDDGSVIRSWDVGALDNTTRNIFTIRELLDAAGIGNIDEIQSTPTKNESMRTSGVVILVTITYTNWVSGSLALSAFNLRHFTYAYRVQHVQSTEYKVYESQYLNFPTQKIISNRHGIRFVFVPEGKIGRFDFTVLMISLVSSFGLTSAAVILLDIVATNFLKERRLYSKHKYDDVKPTSGDNDLSSPFAREPSI